MSERIKKRDGKDDYGIYCTEIVSQTDTGNTRLSEHSHRRVEIIYALDVNADIVIGGTPFRFQSGDIAVIAPDTSHFEHIEGNGRYFSIKIPSDLLFSPLRGLSEYTSFGKFISQNSEKLFFEKSDIASTDIHDTVIEIMREWEARKAGYEQIIRAGIVKILTLLSRIQNEQSILLSTSQSNAISRALAYISYNCTTATERSVAEHCGLSLSYFSTLFKSSVGMKFNDYLIRAKLDRAKTLLISTNKSMTYIAFETGFSSSSHFIARFREHEGMTPLKYRADARSGKGTRAVSTPQFIVRFENVGQASGSHLILKYRTNRQSDPTWMPFFVETNTDYATNLGLSWAVIYGDEEWHVLIIDMSKTRQLSDVFTPADDGRYYTGHLEIHPFYKTLMPTLYFDLEYAAFADGLEQALGIIGEGEDIIQGTFSTENGDHWIQKELDSDLIPSSNKSLFFTSGEKLLADTIASGVSFRKIEILTENGKDFTRVWCI